MPGTGWVQQSILSKRVIIGIARLAECRTYQKKRPVDPGSPKVHGIVVLQIHPERLGER